MGLTTQAAGIKPYGLVYDLVINKQIPVYWSIKYGKAKDTADLTVNGKDYKGGPFIIPAEWVPFAQTQPSTPGGQRGWWLTAVCPSSRRPSTTIITSFPNSVLDLQNGDKAATAFFTPAEIPTTAYRLGTPADNLTDCDDVYFMPHADPQDWLRRHTDDVRELHPERRLSVCGLPLCERHRGAGTDLHGQLLSQHRTG